MCKDCTSTCMYMYSTGNEANIYMTLCYFSVCSNGISEEGRAALEKLAQEMNLKRGSNGDRLTITF